MIRRVTVDAVTSASGQKLEMRRRALGAALKSEFPGTSVAVCLQTGEGSPLFAVDCDCEQEAAENRVRRVLRKTSESWLAADIRCAEARKEG